MHGLPDRPPASTRSRAQSYWGLSSPAIGRHLSKGSLLAFSSAYLQSYVVVNMNGGFRFGFCRPASEHRSPVWAGFRTEGLLLPSLNPSSRRTSALVAPAGPEPSPVEPTCPCSPALTSPPGGSGELLGGSRQVATWAPRGRLFRELLGASLPAPDRPLGRREGRGGPGAGRGLRSPKLHTHAGPRLAAWRWPPLGANESSCLCVSLLPSVSASPPPPSCGNGLLL